MPGTERVTFTGSGGEQLVGLLDSPDTEPMAFALFAHCFTCSKDSHAAARIAKALTDRGVAVLRFDFTGLGDSGGDFADATFTSNVADLVRAADYVCGGSSSPLLLIGHSLGGAAVLAAAEQIPQVRAVVTLGAPSDPSHVTQLFAATAPEIVARGEADVTLAGRTFRIRRSFLDDIAAQPQRARIAGLGRPLLVLHSPQDEIVGIDNAREIYEAARHPKSFVALDGADHLLTRRPDAVYVAEVVAAWASRYLDTADREAAAAGDSASSPLPAGVVRVASTGRGRFTQRVQAGSHTWLADEPAGVGDDRGPGPYELVLAGLGACTSMTLRMYADRKGWQLDGVAVELRHDRVHVDDCEGCEQAPRLMDRVSREITVTGSLDDEQVAALLRIADRCPVHRTLESEIRIETTGALATGSTR